MAEIALEQHETPPVRAGFRTARAGRAPRDNVESPLPPETRIGWREALVLTPLALLLPRAVLPGGTVSAGLAFILALALTGADHVLWYALAALLSLLTVSTPLSALSYAPSFLLAAYFGRRWSTGGRSIWVVGSVLFLAMAGQALFVLGESAVASRWSAILLQAAVTGVLAFVLACSVPILRHGPLASGGREERLFLALIPFALAIQGLAHISVFGMSLAAIGAAFIVALLGYLGGPGLGAGMGVLLSMSPSLGYGPWPMAGGLALGGFLTGLLRGSGRPAMMLGFCAGFGLPFLWYAARMTPSWPVAGQVLIGLGMFLALPDQPLRNIGLVMPAGNLWGAAKRAEQARLRELLSDRVQQLAGVFSQMSKAFQADREQETRPDLYTLLDQVVRHSCQQCAGFETCWRQNFYASYRELFDLIALAEMNGTAKSEYLSGRLATACFQQRKLLETVDEFLARAQTSLQAHQQTADGRGFVAGQLEGVAEIMTGLVTEMRLDVEFRVEVEDRLKASFNRLGLAVESLSVLEYAPDMLEVRVKKHGCLNHFECQYLIAPMVSRLLGHTFALWDKQCSTESCHDCSFSLVPASRFQVRHAVGRIAKQEGCCGDNHALVQTKDGRYALILSDGMGTGPKAAQESQATVNLLAQLLSSGMKEEFALNLINSVLMLRTPEERFATVDIAIIDLFRGQAELIKVGAAPSYVKRGRQVIPIRASTPPAGILQKIEVDRQRQPLAVGDYLILVSDGVFSGELGPDETENWVERALSRVEVAGPQPMVDFLLKLAQTNMGSKVQDDVTVIVAQLLTAGTPIDAGKNNPSFSPGEQG